MSPRLRLSLVLIFAVGFAITAPLVLLYTAGYTYDWKKRRVEKTGIIQTDSIPEGARVLLNGVAQKHTTPASLSRLLPEEYRVRFEKDGYYAWEKTVEVRPAQTSFVTGAVLLSDSPEQLRHEDLTDAAMFTTDGARVAYFRTADTWHELVTVDLRARSATAAEPHVLARFADGALEKTVLAWSPDNRRLLLTGTGERKRTNVLVYDVAGNKAPISLHDSFPATTLSASWSDDGATVVATAASGVFFADGETGTVTSSTITDHVADALLHDRELYLLRTAPGRVDLERQGATIATLPAGSYRFLHRSGPSVLISDITRGRLIVVSPEQGAIADTLSASDATWITEGREPRLLAWNAYEITAYEPRSRGRTLVTRLGSRIDGCAWHPSGDAVFYVTDGEIRAVDLDQRQPKNTYVLAHVSDFAGFAADADNDILRFMGSTDQGRGIHEKMY